jgi:parvulin-like peptidyl-prolyl isomerase
MRNNIFFQTIFLARITGILLACFMFLPAALKASDDAVIIQLNNEVLTLAEYNKYFMFALQIVAEQQGISLDVQEPSRIENLHRQYLSQRISEMVLLQEASKRNISPSLDEIELQKFELYELLGGPVRLKELAAKSGISSNDELNRIITERQTISLVTAMLQNETVISPGDVVVLHHDIQDQLTVPEQTCVRQILVGSKATADLLMSRLDREDNFELIMSEYTSASGQVNQDDNISCFAKERLLPGSEFEKAVFNTNIGEIAGPLKTGLGYHILKVVERKPAYLPGLNEVYQALEQELKEERLPAIIAEIVQASGVVSFPERLELDY